MRVDFNKGHHSTQRWYYLLRKTDNGGHWTENSYNLVVYPTQMQNMTFTNDESTSMVLLKGWRFLQSRPQWVQKTYPLEGFGCMLSQKKKLEIVMLQNVFWRHFGKATLPPIKVPGESWSSSLLSDSCWLLHTTLTSNNYCSVYVW